MERLDYKDGKYRLVVEKQDNGYCSFRQFYGENSETVEGSQYFVCNGDMKIIQWKSYLKSCKQVCKGLKELGFKLPF